MWKQIYYISLFIIFFLSSGILSAQDENAKIALSFVKGDSINYCNAFVTAGDTPVKDVEVKLYVQRMFSLLPVGDAVTTDENGMASFEFPNDIPADQSGKLIIFAKVEDDENLGSIETSGESTWGAPRNVGSNMARSLAGSRANAPIYFIVITNLIIAGIWGTLIYVVSRLFKIRSISRNLHKNK